MTSANIYTENFEMSFLISAVAKAEVNYTGLKIYLKHSYFLTKKFPQFQMIFKFRYDL